MQRPTYVPETDERLLADKYFPTPCEIYTRNLKGAAMEYKQDVRDDAGDVVSQTFWGIRLPDNILQASLIYHTVHYGNEEAHMLLSMLDDHSVMRGRDLETIMRETSDDDSAPLVWNNEWKDYASPKDLFVYGLMAFDAFPLFRDPEHSSGPAERIISDIVAVAPIGEQIPASMLALKYIMNFGVHDPQMEQLVRQDDEGIVDWMFKEADVKPVRSDDLGYFGIPQDLASKLSTLSSTQWPQERDNQEKIKTRFHYESLVRQLSMMGLMADWGAESRYRPTFFHHALK